MNVQTTAVPHFSSFISSLDNQTVLKYEEAPSCEELNEEIGDLATFFNSLPGAPKDAPSPLSAIQFLGSKDAIFFFSSDARTEETSLHLEKEFYQNNENLPIGASFWLEVALKNTPLLLRIKKETTTTVTLSLIDSCPSTLTYREEKNILSQGNLKKESLLVSSYSDIPLSKINRFFFEALVKTEKVSELYENILPSLEGKKTPPVKDTSLLFQKNQEKAHAPRLKIFSTALRLLSIEAAEKDPMVNPLLIYKKFKFCSKLAALKKYIVETTPINGSFVSESKKKLSHSLHKLVQKHSLSEEEKTFYLTQIESIEELKPATHLAASSHPKLSPHPLEFDIQPMSRRSASPLEESMEAEKIAPSAAISSFSVSQVHLSSVEEFSSFIKGWRDSVTRNLSLLDYMSLLTSALPPLSSSFWEEKIDQETFIHNIDSLLLLIQDLQTLYIKKSTHEEEVSFFKKEEVSFVLCHKKLLFITEKMAATQGISTADVFNKFVFPADNFKEYLVNTPELNALFLEISEHEATLLQSKNLPLLEMFRPFVTPDLIEAVSEFYETIKKPEFLAKIQFFIDQLTSEIEEQKTALSITSSQLEASKQERTRLKSESHAIKEELAPIQKDISRHTILRETQPLTEKETEEFTNLEARLNDDVRQKHQSLSNDLQAISNSLQGCEINITHFNVEILLINHSLEAADVQMHFYSLVTEYIRTRLCIDASFETMAAKALASVNFDKPSPLVTYLKEDKGIEASKRVPVYIQNLKKILDSRFFISISPDHLCSLYNDLDFNNSNLESLLKCKEIELIFNLNKEYQIHNLSITSSLYVPRLDSFVNAQTVRSSFEIDESAIQYYSSPDKEALAEAKKMSLTFENYFIRLVDFATKIESSKFINRVSLNKAGTFLEGFKHDPQIANACLEKLYDFLQDNPALEQEHVEFILEIIASIESHLLFLSTSIASSASQKQEIVSILATLQNKKVTLPLFDTYKGTYALFLLKHLPFSLLTELKQGTLSPYLLNILTTIREKFEQNPYFLQGTLYLLQNSSQLTFLIAALQDLCSRSVPVPARNLFLNTLAGLETTHEWKPLFGMKIGFINTQGIKIYLGSIALYIEFPRNTPTTFSEQPVALHSLPSPNAPLPPCPLPQPLENFRIIDPKVSFNGDLLTFPSLNCSLFIESKKLYYAKNPTYCLVKYRETEMVLAQFKENIATGKEKYFKKFPHSEEWVELDFSRSTNSYSSSSRLGNFFLILSLIDQKKFKDATALFRSLSFKETLSEIEEETLKSFLDMRAPPLLKILSFNALNEGSKNKKSSYLLEPLLKLFTIYNDYLKGSSSFEAPKLTIEEESLFIMHTSYLTSIALDTTPERDPEEKDLLSLIPPASWDHLDFSLNFIKQYLPLSIAKKFSYAPLKEILLNNVPQPVIEKVTPLLKRVLYSLFLSMETKPLQHILSVLPLLHHRLLELSDPQNKKQSLIPKRGVSTTLLPLIPIDVLENIGYFSTSASAIFIQNTKQNKAGKGNFFTNLLKRPLYTTKSIEETYPIPKKRAIEVTLEDIQKDFVMLYVQSSQRKMDVLNYLNSILLYNRNPAVVDLAKYLFKASDRGVLKTEDVNRKLATYQDALDTLNAKMLAKNSLTATHSPLWLTWLRIVFHSFSFLCSHTAEASEKIEELVKEFTKYKELLLHADAELTKALNTFKTARNALDCFLKVDEFSSIFENIAAVLLQIFLPAWMILKNYRLKNRLHKESQNLLSTTQAFNLVIRQKPVSVTLSLPFTHTPTQEIASLSKEDLEEQILSLASKKSDPSFIKRLQFLSGEKIVPGLEGLLMLFERGNFHEYKDSLLLNEEEIKELDALLGLYLLKDTENLLEKGARRNYEMDHSLEARAFLFFESRNQLILRENQVTFLKKLWKSSTPPTENEVKKGFLEPILTGSFSSKKPEKTLTLAELGTGTGKSKVLASLMSWWQRKRNQSIINVWPASLFFENKKDSTKQAKDTYNQGSFDLVFTRDSLEAPNAIFYLMRDFNHAIQNGCQINTTPETLHSLRLKFFEMLYNQNATHSKQEVLGLQRILMAIEDMYVQADELHENASPKISSRYSIGNKSSVPASQTEIILALYKKLMKRDLWKQALLNGTMHSFTKEEYVSLAEDLVKEYATEFHLPEKDLTAFIFDKVKIKPSSIEKHPQRETLNLLKGEFSQILKATVASIPGVNFGPSKVNPSLLFAIPYTGNDSPKERSVLNNVHETVNKTLQYYLYIGISPKIFDQFLTHINPLKDLPPFGPAKENLKLYKDNPNKKKEFLKNHFKDPEFIFYIFKYLIRLQIHQYLESIEQNAQDFLFTSSKNMLGMSATPGPLNAYKHSSRINHLSLPGEEDLIKQIVLNKTDITFHALSTTDAESRINEILPILLKDPLSRMLIDQGALLKGVENRYIAQRLLEAMEENPLFQEIQGIIFYHNDQECILTKQSQVVPRNLRPELQKENLFTFCDQKRSFGADIPQIDNARGFVTLNTRSTYLGKIQADGRLRKLAQNQSVSYICEDASMYEEKEALEATYALNAYLEKNQKEVDKENLYHSIVQQIQGVFKEQATRKLLLSSDPFKEAPPLKPLLVNESSLDTAELYGKMNLHLAPHQLFEDLKKELEKKYLPLFNSSEKGKIKENMTFLFNDLRKISKDSLPEKVLPTEEAQDQGVATSVATEVAIEVHVSITPPPALAKVLFKDTIWPADINLYDPEWITPYLHKKSGKRGDPHFNDISFILQPEFASLFRDEGFEFLCSSNFVHPRQKMFGPEQTEADQVFIQEVVVNGALKYQLLLGNNKDTAFWKKKIRKGADSEESKGPCLYGLHKENITARKNKEAWDCEHFSVELKKAILKLQLLNGNFDFTTDSLPLVKEILDQDPRKWLQFLKQSCEHKPHRAARLKNALTVHPEIFEPVLKEESKKK